MSTYGFSDEPTERLQQTAGNAVALIAAAHPRCLVLVILKPLDEPSLQMATNAVSPEVACRLAESAADKMRRSLSS